MMVDRWDSKAWAGGRVSRTAILTALSLLLCASYAAAQSKPTGRLAPTGPLQISATPITYFHKDGEPRKRIGKLIWRGGLVLRSQSKVFGGYSGLEMSDDGRRLLAVSDGGVWLAANLKYRGGRPLALEDAMTGPLLALNRQQLRRGRDRDAEALRLVSGTLDRGRVLVAFERNQRIGLFRLAKGQIMEPLSYLKPGLRLPDNKGFESAAILLKGRYRNSVLAFAERFIDPRGHHRGWIWTRGKPRPVALTNLAGFDITDAVGLPDGDVVILERRFRWTEGVRMRLRLVDGDKVRPGAVLSGITLMSADLRYEIDNMEGLAAHRDAQGKLILTIISDDNFNPLLQRTLLLQFEMPGR